MMCGHFLPHRALATNCSAPFNDKEGAEAKDWKKGKPVRVVRVFPAFGVCCECGMLPASRMYYGCGVFPASRMYCGCGVFPASRMYCGCVVFLASCVGCGA